MPDQIRLLIVDDHPLVRRSLAELFDAEPDVTVVAAVDNGEEAVTVANEERPDVVLMDISMPGVNGIEAASRIVAADPDAKIVMLTSYGDAEHVIDSIDSGAVGFLLKDADNDELIRGVHAAARGEAPLAPRAARALLAARKEKSPLQELTPREVEVLGMLGRGLANKQIAWRLGISEKTVKAHLTQIFQTIGVADRTQAALWAERHLSAKS